MLLIDKLRTYEAAARRRKLAYREAVDKAMVDMTVAELNLGIARFRMTGELQTFAHGRHMLNCLPPSLIFDVLNRVDMRHVGDILIALGLTSPKGKR